MNSSDCSHRQFGDIYIVLKEGHRLRRVNVDANLALTFVDNLLKLGLEVGGYDLFAFMLKALIKKTQEELNPPEEKFKEDVELTQSQIDRVKKFGMYSKNVYNASWKEDLDKIKKDFEDKASKQIVIG